MLKQIKLGSTARCQWCQVY